MPSEVSLRRVLICIPAVGLASGLGLRLAGLESWVDWVWSLSTVPVLLALLAQIIRSLSRGDIGLDILAGLSMTAALAFGQALAAVVVALMYAGGQFLEAFAKGRARREMTALLSRVPQSAMCYRDGRLIQLSTNAIVVGDQLLVRQGDVLPVDGRIMGGVAVLDQSALTGESLPCQRRVGEGALSGSTNVGEAFRLVASNPAAQSTFAGIIRLVETAQQS